MLSLKKLTCHCGEVEAEVKIPPPIDAVIIDTVPLALILLPVIGPEILILLDDVNSIIS